MKKNLMTDTKNLVTSIVTRFFSVYIGTASGTRIYSFGFNYYRL